MMVRATSSANSEIRNDDDNKKKLTKVISTKLSIEDYNRFEKYTNYAYKAGMIEELKTSKFLRYIITVPFKILQVESANKDS